MKQKQKNNQVSREIVSNVISLYLFVMLGFYPLYYKQRYADMGDAKYKIFLYASVICVALVFIFVIGSKLFQERKKSVITNKKNTIAIMKESLMPLDMAIIIYFVMTLISFLCSPFKEIGFWGSDGWNMGFLAQFLFVAVYFITAKFWKYEKWILWIFLTASFLVFLIAVFHRFDIDIFQIYDDLDLRYKVLFLSTMGQSSWYSSFLCTVYPIGLFVFFDSTNKRVRWISGIYSVVAMCSLVTQNTDSAFLSLAAVILLLFYLSFDETEKRLRFIEVLILILGSFCFMGVCRYLFPKRAIPLDSLSVFMSQSIFVWLLLVLTVAWYALMKKKKGNILWKNKNRFWLVLAIVLAGIALTVLIIVLNTNGFLLKQFGIQSSNNYLLFNEQWGNGRGFAWKFAVSSFGQLPFVNKLLGVGPDCFSAYIESVPEHLEAMQAFWGDLVLTNAHNEYLTKLYNLGIAGAISYLGMLGVAIWSFCKNRSRNSFLPVFALCTISYMTHNIFCYEQVCCTPFFYILLGMGSNLIYNNVKKGAY